MSSAVPNKIKFSIDNPNIRDHGNSNIDRFGQSIALSGSYMLIGAPREEQGPGFSPRRNYPNFQDPWSVREVTDIMRDYWATLYINWPDDLEIDVTDQIDLETQTLLHNCTSNVFDLHEGLDIRSAAQREADWDSDEADRITELGYLLPNGYLDDEYRHPTGVLHFYAVETATRFNSIRRPLPPEASSYPMDIEPNFGYTTVIDDGKVATSAIRDHVGGYVAELADSGDVIPTYRDDMTYCWDHDTYTLVPASNYVEECGMVYIFGLADQEFRLAIEPPVPETGMFFGFSMAAKNNVLVVGAPTATSSEAENAGRVWSFDMTTGTMLREFINPEITGNDLFGYSVAISDSYVAIGAPKDENNIDPEATPGTDEGRVYVYNRSTGAFIYSVKSPTPQDSGWFGYSVSITEGEFEGQQYNVLAVGAPGELDGDNEARGKCHLFRLPTGILAKSIVSPEAAPVEGNDRDFFGAKVIVKGDMLAVGAPLAEAASEVFQTYSWTGDGVTTDFSIGGLLGDNILTVTVNGNTVTNYTVVETNIVFDVAPLSGSTIVAQLSLPIPADEYYSNLSRGIVYLYRITTTLDAVIL